MGKTDVPGRIAEIFLGIFGGFALGMILGRMRKKCPHCKRINTSGYKYCKYCSTELK